MIDYARLLAAQGHYAEALETMLRAAKVDSAARQAMLEVFDKLGSVHPLVIEYRRKLGSVLH